MIKVFYFSLKYLISIPYEIGKSGHIISIISCLEKCGVWRRNVVSKRHYTILCAENGSEKWEGFEDY